MVGIFLVAELLLLGSLAFLVAQSQAEAIKEANSKNVSGKLSAALRSVQEIVYTVATDSKGKDILESIQPEHVRGDLAKLRVELTELQKISRTQPEYRARITKLAKRLTKVVDLIGDGLTALETNDMKTIATVAAVCGARSPVTAKLIEEAESLISEQRIKQAEISKSRQQLRSSIEVLLGAGVLIDVVLAILLMQAFVKGISDKLLILSHNTELLSRGQQLEPAMDQKDEIGVLDRSFREMSIKIGELAHKQKAIIENTHDVICSLNKDLSFVSVSPAAVGLWGYDPNALIGRSVTSVARSDDTDSYRNTFAQVISKQQGEFELSMRNSSGDDLHMLWSARWSPEDQNMVCIAHDITERKKRQGLLQESERNLRSMLDNVSSGLLICTYDGRIEYSNHRLCDMLGYDSQSLNKQNLLDLFHKKPNIASPESFFANQLELSRNNILEFEMTHKSETSFPVEMSFTELDTVDGKRLLVNMADITERRQIERTKQEFVAMVSHDLRTPLSSVGGYLELLIEEVYGELIPERSISATKAHENVDALLRVINDLLEITKLEAGKLEMERKKHWLSRLAKAAFSLVQMPADEASITLQFVEPDLEIRADKSRFCKVLENILFYSIKNSVSPSSITISAKNRSNDVEILITASGLTLSSDRSETLFDRYAKTQHSNRKPILSLAICKAIITELGGNVWAEPSPDMGSNFRIRLPI
ncbi:MAG: PAS domain S-box protein [Candidatus Obscuribacterales bacterium]|nr:PAS domain S-box protein [Candidatus Obscuribacterales bacterium]